MRNCRSPTPPNLLKRQSEKGHKKTQPVEFEKKMGADIETDTGV
jgi:hypothetical protein